MMVMRILVRRLGRIVPQIPIIGTTRIVRELEPGDSGDLRGGGGVRNQVI